MNKLEAYNIFFSKFTISTSNYEDNTLFIHQQYNTSHASHQYNIKKENIIYIGVVFLSLGKYRDSK